MMAPPTLLRRLALPLTALALAIAVSTALIYGSYWLHQRAEAIDRTRANEYRAAQAALAKAQMEDADFRASANRYAELKQRGIAKPEDRLLMTEWLNGLRAQYQLIELNYSLSSQRPLKLVNDPGFGAINPLSTRITISATTAHEGDALGFMDSLARDVPGFLHLTECSMQPPQASATSTLTASQNLPELAPRIALECALEWITVKEKVGA